MKGRLSIALILLVTLVAVPGEAWAQGGWTGRTSSEWEATGFNNGRRMVRDANGYFHAFWHSQPNAASAPAGTGCHLYYAYTTAPASEPPSMAQIGAWSAAVDLTPNLLHSDDRYPSVAIAYETFDGNWQAVNTLHVVWQGMGELAARYDVYYANIAVANPPTAPPPWSAAVNLSNTPTDSLVPAIGINQYGPALSQHLHVVWQEEDILTPMGLPGGTEDADFSVIAYLRSVNGGAAWAGPAGGWAPHAWDRLTATPENAQLPSIACLLDQYTAPPAPGKVPPDFGYNSTSVHVAWHQDFNNDVRVYYQRSLTDGGTWNPPVDISTATFAITDASDAYANIAVDMGDNPHITFMRLNMVTREPMRTTGGVNDYLPGVNPAAWRSFPGPDIGMYGVLPNMIVHTFSPLGGAGGWTLEEWGLVSQDNEFPTVALDRWQHVNVNWQAWFGPAPGDYEILRVSNLNLLAPAAAPPVAPPNYQGWMAAPASDSLDSARDDLFPNLAHKKAAPYVSSLPGGAPNEPAACGFDEVWTKIPGHGPIEAIAPGANEIWQNGNMTWDNTLAVDAWLLY